MSAIILFFQAFKPLSFDPLDRKLIYFISTKQKLYDIANEEMYYNAKYILRCRSVTVFTLVTSKIKW